MTNFRPTGKISFNQQFTHNVSPIPGMDKLSPFFLIFGRHAPSPETFTLQLALPSKSLSQQTYVENQVSRLSDAKKEFDRIKADLQRSQQERYDQNAHNLQVHDGMRVCVHRPPPSAQPQGLSPRFRRCFDGPFIVQGLVHGRQDLIKLRHEITGQDIGVVNIEKICRSHRTFALKGNLPYNLYLSSLHLLNQSLLMLPK